MIRIISIIKQWGVEGAIKQYFEQHGVYPKVKVVVCPCEKPLMEDGVYDDFEIIGFKTKSHLMSTWNLIQVKRNDIILSGGKRYDLSEIVKYGGDRKHNNIILFIEGLNFEL